MVEDVCFDLNNIDSYELLAKHIQKTNVLERAGIRHSVPLNGTLIVIQIK